MPVVSRGPSLKTCPRCAPQFLQTTSVRLIKSELSSCSSMFSLFTGSSKLGHPVPESNLASDENNGAPQATHSYIPFSWLLKSAPVKARSVPLRRQTLYCSGVSFSFQYDSGMSLRSFIAHSLHV